MRLGTNADRLGNRRQISFSPTEDWIEEDVLNLKGMVPQNCLPIILVAEEILDKSGIFGDVCPRRR